MPFTYSDSFSTGTLDLLSAASGSAHAVPPVTPLPTPGGGWVVWDSVNSGVEPAGVLLVAAGDENYRYINSYAQHRIKWFANTSVGMRLWLRASPNLVAPCVAVSVHKGGNDARVKFWDGSSFATSWALSGGSTNADDGSVVRVEWIGQEIRVQVNGNLLGAVNSEILDLPDGGWHGSGASHDGIGCSFTDWQCGPLVSFSK